MKIKRIIDISRKISNGMAVWPGDEQVEIKRNKNIKDGNPANVSQIKLSLHTGTHVDAPLHFIDGAKNIDAVDLSGYIGFVKVFELKVKKHITLEDIKDLSIDEGDTIFFKTSNSNLVLEDPFYEDYIYIDETAAKYLIDRKVKAVGVDYLSVEGYHGKGNPVHKILLSNSVTVIEGLCFKNVDAGEYLYSCLPLRIDNGDGSPVRAVLVELEN